MSRKPKSRCFEIESFGNGFAYEIVRKSDGATVFLQGDDAIRIGIELDQTSKIVTEDDVASQYFGLEHQN